MPGRIMSDAEIKRRKRLQGHLSQTTGALGLAAMTGTLAASRPGRRALRGIPKIGEHIKKPPPRDPNKDRIKGAVTPVLATSAGIGGLGAFNFAAYTNAESRKRQTMAQPPKKKVVKRDEMAPEYGEVAKAWTPQTTPYDPEKKRMTRNQKQQVGAYAGGGALLGAAGAQAGIAGGLKRKAHEAEKDNLKAAKKYKNTKSWDLPKKDPKLFQRAARYHKLAGKNIKTAGALATAGAAAVGTGEFIRHRKKSTSWEPYAKRDAVSAFGIDHTEWTHTRD